MKQTSIDDPFNPERDDPFNSATVIVAQVYEALRAAGHDEAVAELRETTTLTGQWRQANTLKTEYDLPEPGESVDPAEVAEEASRP